MKRLILWLFGAVFAVFMGIIIAFCVFFPRPSYQALEGSSLPRSLVYAVIKAESGFDEKAESRAGAIGLMQLLPSTAEFICKREGIAFEVARLREAEYNVSLGCAYLEYLLARFSVLETALAAYNAGEGVVGEWLRDHSLSVDGQTLLRIPYAETEDYVKKIKNFQKIYEFFCDKT